MSEATNELRKALNAFYEEPEEDSGAYDKFIHAELEPIVDRDVALHVASALDDISEYCNAFNQPPNHSLAAEAIHRHVRSLIPGSAAVLLAEREARVRDSIMQYAKNRRAEYAYIVSVTTDQAKKLAAECRELAYFDMMKEIERQAAKG